MSAVLFVRSAGWVLAAGAAVGQSFSVVILLLGAMSSWRPLEGGEGRLTASLCKSLPVMES